MKHVVALMVTLTLPVAATAQDRGQNGARTQEGPRTPVAARTTAGETPQRIRSVTVAPGERCPASTSEEVIVCYRPDGSPYRIPSELRDDRPVPAANQSWVNRAATIDQVGRVSGGLPNTCSPVGTGGQTGCALIQQPGSAAERRAQRRAEESIPGGEE